MNLEQVKNELGAYFRVNNKEVRSWVYANSTLSDYARPITKVKGKFPAFHSITSNVIQGFAATWNELGETKFRVNELTSFHQKVNFPIIPSEIENSWLAELDQLNLKPADRPISKYIAEQELKPRVMEDIADLEINGIYDSGDLGTFGKSMNGLIKLLQLGLADADNPMYKIPIAPLTDSNLVDEVTAYERGLPNKVKRFIKQIFMSRRNFERYILDYENTYGTNVNFTDEKKVKTRLGMRQIVPLDYMDGSDLIWATVDGNLLKLIDLQEPPTVTDIQVLDYKVKIFMEFWLGYGFWSNQAVFVSNTVGSGSGLHTDNDLYWGN